MAKFSLLYTDVSNLDVDDEMLNFILDDILELQAKMDELHDKYTDLLDACMRANRELDGVL